MILFKKWAKHRVKYYICCVNQVLREKCHKKWNQECKRKQSRLFGFCNIFYLLTSRTEKIAWWLPVFKPDFHIFSYNIVANSPGFPGGSRNLVFSHESLTDLRLSRISPRFLKDNPENNFMQSYFSTSSNFRMR